VPILDVVLPLRCVACRAGETFLCAACRDALVPIRPPLCARCGAPTAWPVERCRECAGRRIPFRTARAAVAYEGAARALIAAWKERGLRRLASEVAALVAEAVPRPDAEAIAYVPGDRDRTRWRGRNPAEALARELSARWELPVVDVLVRSRRVPRQRGLARDARRANVRGSVRAAAAPPLELRRAGARVVEVVTFARAIRRTA
jgi:predicted amidophosphoribosyltransferase